MNKRKIKRIISYILAFILVILLTASSALIILSTTILNKNYVKNKFAKEDYYTRIYQLIMEKFKDNTIQSGLEETVLDGVISIEQVESDTAKLVDYIYTGGTINVDTATVKNNLTQNINKVIEENNKKVLSDEQKAIDTYIKTLTEIYESNVIISKDFMPEVHNVVSSIQKITKKVAPFIYIATIVVLIILIILRKTRSLKYIAIAFTSTGILLIIPKIIELIAMRIKKVLLFTQALSDVVINIVENVMLEFLILRNCYFRSRIFDEYFKFYHKMQKKGFTIMQIYYII